MATKKAPKAPKKKEHLAGSILDGIGWAVRETALPIPDMLFEKKKKKK